MSKFLVERNKRDLLLVEGLDSECDAILAVNAGEGSVINSSVDIFVRTACPTPADADEPTEPPPDQDEPLDDGR